MEDVLREIEKEALENNNFRKVLKTGEHTQIVVMNILPGEDIGMEVHSENDQVLFLVKGKGKVVLNGKLDEFNKGDLVLVKAGIEHNFINTEKKPMKIITFYSPPNHPEATVHKTKEEAEKAE